jgi:Protein of unknown function (DUF3987)
MSIELQRQFERTEKVGRNLDKLADSRDNALILDPAAFYGIAGDIVRTIEPQTEADPAALLLQLIVMAGSIIGRGPHYQVEADEHHANIFAVIVGETSKGRKGTAESRVRSVFQLVSDTWAQERIQTGLSSGEGLIWHVRDQTAHEEEDGKRVIDDHGIADKRLMVVEPEFASTLRVMERDGNTLSPVIRQSWDRGNLRTMTKHSPAVATEAHISIIGHITSEELRRYLTRTESGNGFANRFLFACARRSKVLPEGGQDVDLSSFARQLAQNIGTVRQFGRVLFNDEARMIWHGVYPKLSEGKPGLIGAVTSRAEAQTVRLALIYALMDASEHIRAEHLKAALAVWGYCEASARYVFGDQIGDPVADNLLQAIRDAGAQGITRTDAHQLFGRHRSKERLAAAFDVLVRLERVQPQERKTEGRSATVYVATP